MKLLSKPNQKNVSLIFVICSSFLLLGLSHDTPAVTGVCPWLATIRRYNDSIVLCLYTAINFIEFRIYFEECSIGYSCSHLISPYLLRLYVRVLRPKKNTFASGFRPSLIICCVPKVFGKVRRKKNSVREVLMSSAWFQ